MYGCCELFVFSRSTRVFNIDDYPYLSVYSGERFFIIVHQAIYNANLNVLSKRAWICAWKREMFLLGKSFFYCSLRVAKHAWSNTAAKRFATARRHCSQLKKRAGNYWVIYIGPKVPHNFPYYKNTTETLR